MSHLRRNWFRRTEQSTLFVSHVPSQERRKWALSCRRRPRPQRCITHRAVGCLCDGSGGPRCSGSGSNKGFVALNARLRSPGQSATDLSRSRGLARGSTLVGGTPAYGLPDYGLCSWSRDKYGTTLCPPLLSRMILSVPPRMRSMVSRYMRLRVISGAFLYCS